MVPEDLLFWITAIDESSTAERMLLCNRHADAMVVPRGWTLDDRRDPTLRLFKPRPLDPDETPSSIRRPRRTRTDVGRSGGPVQLQIDGTGEIDRPDVAPDRDAAAAEDAPHEPVAPGAWRPSFDTSDDLGGLLEVTSPLLARAFRGTDRSRR